MKINEIEKQLKKLQKEVEKLRGEKYLTGETILDAQVVKTIFIGDLEWTLEDLAVKPSFGIGDEVGAWEHKGKYYYNWYAANIIAREVGDGWRLPTKEEFEALAEELGEDIHKVMKPELNGYCISMMDLLGQGSYGYWWSSTPYSTTNAYSMYFTSSAVYPSNSDYKGNGFTVRLVRDIER